MKEMRDWSWSTGGITITMRRQFGVDIFDTFRIIMEGSFVGELGNDSVELVESDKLVGRGLLADVSAVE